MWCFVLLFVLNQYQLTLIQLCRFPLRVVPSELSETVYNREKMSTLFQSFQADAHLVLIFLKSVETVELSTRLVENSNENSKNTRYILCTTVR